MKEFITFMVENYMITIIVVSFGNYFVGVMAGTLKTAFQFKLAFKGLVEIVLSFIAYVLVGMSAYALVDLKVDVAIGFITVNDLVLSVLLFKTLAIMIVLYRFNSQLLNFVVLSKIPMPKIMTTFDNKIKEMFNRENFTSNEDLTNEQAFLIKQEIEALE